jgi:TonB family protein
MSRTRFRVVAALGLTILTAAPVLAQDSVAAARDLYASAAYEDALAVLNRLPESGRPADETRAIEQYRAFCLLALGRTGEAERAIETVVAHEPMYRPTTDLSPRVRTAFSDVRKRVLPAIIQQKYAEAKGFYDRKQFDAAVAAFGRVLEAMSGPDAAAAASQPPLSDLRTLAIGFKDLATTAATPPPLPSTPPPPTPIQSIPPVPKAPKVYTSNDPDVVPPGVIRQDLPAFPGQVIMQRQGMIEVLIDETGAVENAIMRVAVTNAYDSAALAAARNWRFRPAMLNGTPVKYRKAAFLYPSPESCSLRRSKEYKKWQNGPARASSARGAGSRTRRSSAVRRRCRSSI